MAAKRYYWLRLKDDFFKQKEIKKLRKIAGGDTYVIIYLKMQLLSVQNEGKLFFEGIEEDICEELALELDEDVENVKVTFMYLKNYKLIEEIQPDEFLISKVPELIGSESASTQRMRDLRTRQKAIEASHCDADVTPVKQAATVMQRECSVEIDIEKDIDIEKSKDRNRVYIAPSLKKDSEPEYDSVLIPLRDGVSYLVTKEFVEEMKLCYPDVDIEAQLKKMRAWCVSNPQKRKTQKGILKFINSWLSREQDNSNKSKGSWNDRKNEKIKFSEIDLDEDFSEWRFKSG